MLKAAGQPQDQEEPFIFQMADTGPPVVRDVLIEMGWVAQTAGSPFFNLAWGARFGQGNYDIENFQRINHFPSSRCITRKDTLFRMLRRLKATYGATVYDFFPDTWILPNEFVKFAKVLHNLAESQQDALWICKPADLSRGRGISIFRELHQLQYSSR